jgi:hypothetical protein
MQFARGRSDADNRPGENALIGQHGQNAQGGGIVFSFGPWPTWAVEPCFQPFAPDERRLSIPMPSWTDVEQPSISSSGFNLRFLFWKAGLV